MFLNNLFMRVFELRFVFALALLLGGFCTHAQCTNQVIHTAGSSVVYGIDVTVTHINLTDTLTTYCPSVTSPFVIGYNSAIGHGSGQYNFQFTPPASSVTLNFSGINASPSFSDEVMLSVDGSHYVIPAPGMSNGCDAMAVLTATGNITGNASGLKSGWKGLTVPGPIHTLAVADYPVGAAGGVVFSLFVCNSDLGVSAQEQPVVQLYPNPIQSQINITTGDNEGATATIYDMFFRKVLSKAFIGNTSVDATALVPALYYYELQLKNGRVQKGKLVKG
jgi:hypothetical protein